MRRMILFLGFLSLGLSLYLWALGSAQTALSEALRTESPYVAMLLPAALGMFGMFLILYYFMSTVALMLLRIIVIVSVIGILFFMSRMYILDKEAGREGWFSDIVIDALFR